MLNWNERMERIAGQELKKMQLDGLRSQVHRVYESSDLYRRRMEERGVRPDDIQSLEDVTRLPFMFKSDLRDHYPTGLFTVPREEVVRYHASSGTTGKPTVVGYTRADIELWTESLARVLTSCDLGEDDVIQVSYGYGLFTGGLGLHYGAEAIGAAVVPTSVGNTSRQIDLMQDLRVTAIACTPSYLLHMGEVGEEKGIDIAADTELNTALLGAEPWSEKIRERIEDWLEVDAYDIYGTSELSGPLFTECTEKNGIHVWGGDMALVEIIDPETGEPVDRGERGELVVIMLKKEALPIIRYRVGDITRLMEEECDCGRPHPRIGRIQGRVDDMLIIRGVNVFPSQMGHTIMSIPEAGNHFQVIAGREGPLDNMTVRVEVNDTTFSDKIDDLMHIRRKIAHQLRNAINIKVDVELAEPGSLPRSMGKAERIIDKRGKE